MISPRSGFPEEACAIVPAVHATFEGTRTGGSALSDPRRRALPEMQTTIATASAAEPIRLPDSRSSANPLPQSTIPPRLSTQVSKCFRRNRDQPASHCVVSGPAELMAGHFVLPCPRKLQPGFDHIAGHRLDLVLGSADRQFVDYVGARDPKTDRDPARHHHTLRNKKILLRDHPDRHPAARILG